MRKKKVESCKFKASDIREVLLFLINLIKRHHGACKIAINQAKNKFMQKEEETEI